MTLDPVNELTWATAPAKSQTNNTGAFLCDLLGYIGRVAINVNLGAKTVGDADGTIAIRAMTSATNNISNAVNYGTAIVNTSNAATANGRLSVDTRDANRYLFYGVVTTGTNSPAYPLAVSVIGKKQTQ